MTPATNEPIPEPKKGNDPNHGWVRYDEDDDYSGL